MMMTETQHDLVHQIVAISRQESFREGVCRLTVTDEASITVSLSSRDVSTIRGLRDLLWRVARGSREQVGELSGSDERARLLSVAWSLLEPARFLGGAEGDYEVTLPSDRVVRYSLSESDETLLGDYEVLLRRVYSQHREVLDDVTGRGGRGELAATRAAA